MTTISIVPPVNSKHFEKNNFSYPNNLVHVATKSQMTYTFRIRIVEKAYGKTCQIHDSISQIQCYVPVITEKHDLSFQLTYHTLTFDFQTTSAEGNALLDMSRIQTVVLDLRTSNILVLVLPTIDQLISKTCHLEGNQRIQRDTQVHREYPSSAKTRDGERSSPGTAVHAPGAFKKLTSSFVPASVIFVDKTGKIR